MRRAAKIDDNQTQIMVALRQLGFTVQSLATVGNGCPDLLVGRNDKNILLEVKDGRKSPCQRLLNPAQQKWHQHWKGQVKVVCDERQAIDTCLAAVGLSVSSPSEKAGI
jgi:hypothetical protein